MYIINGKGEAEQRKRLAQAPQRRMEIVRDLVSTMYAYTSRPDKDFCTKVAKQLVHKYPFMRDVGVNVSGYVSLINKSMQGGAFKCLPTIHFPPHLINIHCQCNNTDCTL